MVHVYEKNTKETVDLPEYVLCFLNIIMDRLEFYGLIDGKSSKSDSAPPSVLIIPIVSRKYRYCYDGIELIEKTVKRRGFNCKLEHYKTIDIDEKNGTKGKGYQYEYKITKSK